MNKYVFNDSDDFKIKSKRKVAALLNGVIESKSRDTSKKLLEQETLTAEKHIQELKRQAEEEAKNLELIKERKRLEQLHLDEMQRKTPTLPPPPALHSKSGKDFKCEKPDNVEIKDATLLAVKLGGFDNTFDGLYSGSFFQLVGFQEEKHEVIIKESLLGRQRDISHEADIYFFLLKSKKSNGCIEMYGFNKSSVPSFIVLEDFGEDLRNYIHPDVDHDTKRLIMKKCIEALCALHSVMVMHGDLKPANILVKYNRSFTVKLCDLDSARILSVDATFPYDQSTRHLKFTESWVAPEVYQSNKICDGGKFHGSLAIDVFNLGMIATLLESKGGYTSDVVLPLPGTDDYEKALTDQSFLDSRVLKLSANNPHRDILMSMCRYKS